jgi:hypothetical protein
MEAFCADAAAVYRRCEEERIMPRRDFSLVLLLLGLFWTPHFDALLMTSTFDDTTFVDVDVGGSIPLGQTFMIFSPS